MCYAAAVRGLIETVSRYVQLTWEGRQLRGECPFCGESELVVQPDRWRCYSCGAHEAGDDLAAFTRLAVGLVPGVPKPLLTPARPPLSERIKARYPEIPALVAEYTKGLAPGARLRLLDIAALVPKARRHQWLGSAIAQALRAAGYHRTQAGPTRQRHYVKS